MANALLRALMFELVGYWAEFCRNDEASQHPATDYSNDTNMTSGESPLTFRQSKSSARTP